MVSGLVSGSDVTSSSPVWGYCIRKDTYTCFGKALRRVHVTLTVPLSTQVQTCKIMCIVKINLGGNPAMDYKSIQSGGEEGGVGILLTGLCRLILNHFFCFNFFFPFMFGIVRSFIPKSEQPSFDILVGMNGEIMHTRRQPADGDLLPDFSRASDLEFAEYNSRNTSALGRFG